MLHTPDRLRLPSLSSSVLSDTLSHDGEHLNTHDSDSDSELMGPDRIEPSVWGTCFVCLDHGGREEGEWAWRI